jgi:hypothetical protein
MDCAPEPPAPKHNTHTSPPLAERSVTTRYFEDDRSRPRVSSIGCSLYAKCIKRIEVRARPEGVHRSAAFPFYTQQRTQGAAHLVLTYRRSSDQVRSRIHSDPVSVIQASATNSATQAAAPAHGTQAGAT